MQFWLWICFFFFSCFILTGEAAQQDVLILKDGRRIVGKIVEKTDGEITIKVDAIDMELTYFMEDIEAVEKTMLAIVVKDEEEKQKVMKEVLESGAADAVYDIRVLKKKKEPQIISPQEYDPDPEPMGNIGIQAMSAEELLEQNPELNNIGKSMEDLQEEHERKAFPEFFKNR